MMTFPIVPNIWKVIKAVFQTTNQNNIKTVTGWWCNNHLEKYESQWKGLSHKLWKK